MLDLGQSLLQGFQIVNGARVRADTVSGDSEPLVVILSRV